MKIFLKTESLSQQTYVCLLIIENELKCSFAQMTLLSDLSDWYHIFAMALDVTTGRWAPYVA